MEKIDTHIEENVMGHMTRCEGCEYRYLSDVHWPDGTRKTYDCSYTGNWGCAFDEPDPSDADFIKRVILENHFGINPQKIQSL